MTAHLPGPAEYPVLHGWPGSVVLRPWFDRLALRAIARWYFPLSRAWAAALACGGSPEQFIAITYADGARGRVSADRVRRLIETAAARRAAYDAAQAEWEALLFEAPASAPADLVAAQLRRQSAAQTFMESRRFGLRLHLAHAVPPVRWDIVGPDDMPARQQARLVDPAAAFPAPPPQPVAQSHRVPAAHGRVSWLRYVSPVLGDTAWARVAEPAGSGTDPVPTLIFLHGIAMEPEFWRGTPDLTSGLARQGLRVIHPEGPWHGRRRLDGWYGGEPAMGRGPLGLIELFEAWVAEIAALIGWARQQGGAVAIGGVSLGALTAQLAATAARQWPASARPDALFLVTTTGDLVHMADNGSLSRTIGLPARMQAAGWDHGGLVRWAPLQEPRGAPAVSAEHIVMVLGQADDLLPYAGGRDLARRWGIPAANLFVRPQGHFSVSLGLGRAPQPIARLVSLLKGD